MPYAIVYEQQDWDDAVTACAEVVIETGDDIDSVIEASEWAFTPARYVSALVYGGLCNNHKVSVRDAAVDALRRAVTAKIDELVANAE